MKCPKCGQINDDNWPIRASYEIMWGGCQLCWEHESDVAWWDAVESLNWLTDESQHVCHLLEVTSGDLTDSN